MEMNEVETTVSIVTTENGNVSDYIDSPNSLDEFKKPGSNAVEDFLVLLNSEEVKINVELTLEDENNECNKSLENEQQSEILVTETCKNEDEDRFTENEEKNQENMMDVDANNVTISFYFNQISLVSILISSFRKSVRSSKLVYYNYFFLFSL